MMWMKWIKWIIWALVLGVIISIIIAIVGWIQYRTNTDTSSMNAGLDMFGGAVISALTLHASVTGLQVLMWSLKKARNKE